jgi:flagellar motility protein MotE (MotC chaperone)
MKPRFRVPRLLPATIVMLLVVLAAKSTVLIRSAIDHGQPAAFIAAAWATAPETPAPANKAATKPAANPGETAPHSADIKPDVPAVPSGPPPFTEGEKTVLLELRERRQELEAREATLASRESMTAAAEQKLSARVEELQKLQQRLESLDASHRQQENTAWLGLVKVYETMKPRDAAVIFNDLGMPILLAVIDRMKEAKAAAVLAAMAPDKARDVTTQLAALRTKAATVDTADKAALNPGTGKAPGSGT